MKPNFLLPALLLSLVLTGAAEFNLCSQEAGPPRQKTPDRPSLALGGPGAFMAGLGPVANVLTDEQRASFRQAMDAQREAMRNTETKLREARSKLIEAGLAGNFDEVAVRRQAMAVATLEADAAVIRARAISRLQPPLSPEQVEKIKSGLAAAPFRNGLRDADRQPAGERRHSILSTNRDENDLPLKR